MVNLVGGIPTPLKNMTSSAGMMTFPYMKWKIKIMFQSPPTSFSVIFHRFPSVSTSLALHPDLQGPKGTHDALSLR